MFKRVTLIKRKQGMSIEDFKSYYENHHVPMVKRLFPMFADYRRSYITDALRRNGETKVLDFDVITETWYASEADYKVFLDKLSSPGVRDEIMADEARFTDTASTVSCTVQERK